MELGSFLGMVAFVGGVFLIGLTIGAFIQVGLLYSIIAIALTCGAVLLINKYLKNAFDIEKTSKVIIRCSIALIAIGAFMWISCFLAGPTGFVDTHTECGLCGGSGIAFNKICSLCDGRGGASGSEARYTATIFTWLGVLIADAGIVTIIATKIAKEMHTKEQ